MTVGDLAAIYHTGRQRQVLGVAEVVSSPYPDPKNLFRWLPLFKLFKGDGRGDLRSGFLFPQPVTLAELKQQPEFSDSDLLRIPRKRDRAIVLGTLANNSPVR
jgi:predicted RNA-binding protein with PUA-like domain